MPLFLKEEISYRVFVVEDDETGEEFYVRFDERGWLCSGRTIQFRRDCEHIIFIKEYLVNNYAKKT